MAEPIPKFFKPQMAALAGGYRLDVPECRVKLNQNENPWDWPDPLKQDVLERVRKLEWNRYPPFQPSEFEALVARYVGAELGQVLVGNGSNELLYAIFACTLGPGRRVVIPQPTFTLYALLAQILGAEVDSPLLDDSLRYDLEAIARAAKGAAVVVIASPNNPTGCVVETSDVARLAADSEALFILDEAYFDFHGESAIELTKSRRNVVVLRTFSKAFATAGLRFGLMICHPELRGLFSAARLPYNLNIFTMAAVETALAHAGELQRHLEELRTERDRLYTELQRRAGIRVFASRANFLVFETDRGARQLWQALVDRGVLVRDVSAYPKLERALRVTVGRPNENQAFLAALDEAINQGSA